MQPSQPTAIGLGSQIFGDGQDPISSPLWGNKPDHTENERANTPDNCALVTAMASVVIESSGWASAPSYSAVYLSSLAEHLPPLPTNDKLRDARVADPVEGNHKSWAFESYENSLRIDRVFENFSRRVGYQGEQCVRCVDMFRSLNRKLTRTLPAMN
jgi:pre-rRNA-processing protein TSR4